MVLWPRADGRSHVLPRRRGCHRSPRPCPDDELERLVRRRPYGRPAGRVQQQRFQSEPAQHDHALGQHLGHESVDRECQREHFGQRQHDQHEQHRPCLLHCWWHGGNQQPFDSKRPGRGRQRWARRRRRGRAWRGNLRGQRHVFRLDDHRQSAADRRCCGLERAFGHARRRIVRKQRGHRRRIDVLFRGWFRLWRRRDGGQ